MSLNGAPASGDESVFYYVLPGLGIYGGVKKGFHTADALNALGRRCAVASPDGGRPDWFASSSTTLTWDELETRCTADDTVFFSCPADLDLVQSLPARRRVVDMQGASTGADVAMMSRNLDYVTRGMHMSATLLAEGRVAPYVPLGIPDAFRDAVAERIPGTVAVMPRKGDAVLDRVRTNLRADERLVVIDGMSEAEVAAALAAADVFLAISPAEAFGLPPLEAMAAGCCVVGYPGVGGVEFMRHAETAWAAPNGDAEALVAGLRRVLDTPELKEALRSRGREVADDYTMERERVCLRRALEVLEL